MSNDLTGIIFLIVGIILLFSASTLIFDLLKLITGIVLVVKGLSMRHGGRQVYGYAHDAYSGFRNRMFR